MDFFEFLHQVMFGVEAACGVADEELGLGLFGFLVAIKADCGGIAVGWAFDQRNGEAV